METNLLSVPAPTPTPETWRARLRGAPFSLLVVHAAVVAGVIITGWSWTGLVLAVGMYFARMVVLTASYHRYFAHRSFQTSRAFQLVLAVAAQSSAQRGVLWWASHHRWHHKHADTPLDPHSTKQSGFLHAHLGWLFSKRWGQTDPALVADLYKFPELRWLDHGWSHALPAVALALACLFLGGVHGLLWGFGVSTILLWHASFAVNSFAHRFGRQRYDTGDESRNNWLLALLTAGEGWHNNHHRYSGSARQGFFWWEFDLTYYVLRALELLGLVWNLRRVPPHLLARSSTTAAHASPVAQR